MVDGARGVDGVIVCDERRQESSWSADWNLANLILTIRLLDTASKQWDRMRSSTHFDDRADEMKGVVALAFPVVVVEFGELRTEVRIRVELGYDERVEW